MGCNLQHKHHHQALKKLSLILISSVLVFLSSGAFMLHKLQVWQYKINFRTYVKAHQADLSLSTIRIYPSELYQNSSRVVWEDDNEEFVFLGTKYDVLSLQRKQDFVELTAICDTEEKELEQAFSSFYDQSNTHQRSPLTLLKQFLSLKYLFSQYLVCHCWPTNLPSHQTVYLLRESIGFLCPNSLPPIQH